MKPGGDYVGQLTDLGFNYLIESKKLIPDGPVFTKHNPAAVTRAYAASRPEPSATFANEIESWSGKDHYEDLVGLNIRDGRWLSDADLSVMDRPD